MFFKLSALSRFVLIPVIASAVFPGLPARAQNTLQVPANFPTIQSAINIANSGDTVLVAPGTYVENINFSGKAITVTSSGGPAVTIIDGNHNGTVVTFDHSETAASVLSGFTIRNGFQNGGFGAGITITSASPTITSNTITGNHAATGIGIFVNGGSCLIQGNTISYNDQTGAGSGGSGGGGILVSGGSSGTVQIIGNTITNNTLLSGGQGGGVSFSGGGALLQGNLISGNVAYNDGGGITAYNTFAPLTIVENVVINNTAQSGRGGGLNLSLPSSSAALFITNNTIANNAGYANTSGVYTTGFAQPATFANNIIVAPWGQYPVTCGGTYSTLSPSFSHNDAYSIGSSSPGFNGFCVASSFSNNFSADPQFLSAANNDYHLASGSPGVDAGDNSASGLPTTDFDNNPRITDGNGDGVATVDLGAYELVITSLATLNPSSLTFASSAVGSPSSPQTVTLSSGGSASFQITSVQIGGDFTEASACPVLGAPGDSSGVAPGSSCAYSIAFTPTASGIRTGSLVVNGTNGARLTVALTGVSGSTPLGSLSVASLNFSGQVVGQQSTPQVVVFSNVGGGPLPISSISTGGAFSQSNNCGSSLAAGTSCSISVVFSPSNYGPANTTLLIADNTDNQTYSLSLSGNGLDFTMSSVAPSSNLVAGSSMQIAITVSPLGGSFPNSVSLSCSALPLNAACSFSPANVVPGTAAVTTTLTLSSQFSTPGGTFPVTVTGLSGGTLSRSVSLQLTILKPGLTLSTSSVTFPNQSIGTASSPRSVTLSNSSVGPVNLSSIITGVPFSQSNNCGTALPVNSSCVVSVSFSPTIPGLASGTLSILDAVDGLSYSVSLSGAGVDFALSSSTPSVTVPRGGSSSFSVNVSPVGGAFSNPVALFCSGAPAKTNCAFSQSNLIPGNTGASLLVTISNDPSATQAGTYTLTITGTSGSVTHTVQVQVTVSKSK